MFDERPTFHSRILFRVCENGTSHSSVVLALEEDGQGDSVTTEMVQWALENLNADGLVTYRLGSHGVYVHIKPTPRGYDVAGYPSRAFVFQRRVGMGMQDHAPLRPGDTTDFRGYMDHAIGGEIEKMPLEEHLRIYPEHIPIHPSPWELEMSRRGMVDQANGLANSVTPDPQVVAGLVVDGVNKKMLVLEALRRNGRAQTVQDLLHWTKGLDHGMNAREITKILWSLQKLNYVKFTERHQEPVKIELTANAIRDFFPKAVREKAPVERTNVPAKPRIIPTPEYRVPEPPRYAAPPPPPQNTKPFTDVKSEVPVYAEVSSAYAEGTGSYGKDKVVDTHTQYLNETVNIYPNSPQTDPSRRRVLRFLRSIHSPTMGHMWRSFTEIAEAIGQKNTATASLLANAGVKFGYTEIRKNGHVNEMRVTTLGVNDLTKYADQLDTRTPSVPGTRKARTKVFVPDRISDLNAEEPEIVRSAGAVVPRENIPSERRMMRDLSDFPLIKDLMGKEGRLKRYEAAAEILAEDPDDKATADLVLALLEKVQITDLEKEVIRYVRTVSG